MFGAEKTRNQERSAYATRRDFCRIFENDMDRLYLLSFLLTGNETTAERVFVGGLHTAQEGNPVFKEWAESWARRTVILNAIRMMRPRLGTEAESACWDQGSDNTLIEPREIGWILGLPAFERFAFVMSVLEGYSDHECSLHLNCTVSDIRSARTRALGKIGRSPSVDRKIVTISSGKQVPEPNSGSGFGLEALSGLATSA